MQISGLKLLGKVCLLGALAYGQTAFANIGGRVWVDNNCNGIFDAGDVLQPGVTVQLFNCDAGVFVATQVTDLNGAFLFDNFGPPDNYKVCVTLPAGFSFAPQVVVQPPDGDCCDSSVGPDGCTACFFWHDNIDISHNAGLCPSSSPNCPPVSSCIGSGFNGTPIGPNYWIWFNSVIKVSGRGGNPATITFNASTVTFGSTTVTLPPAIITFDSSASTATTTFDTGSGTWHTVVPATYSGNVFLSGVSLNVPGGLPGGVAPVTWCGNFAANSSGLGFQWQWAAAVYQCFSSDMTTVGVKPVDANNLSIYLNSDHAGTPENFKTCVTGGARGGGGSNWTGSYSATKGGTLCQ